ncbi:hypothetical protein T265_07635 [Opisthorchis viverrini]|uniref:Centrosomal protein of 19 kDa n=1 Tax=Opisthorchis viverrini TaxID=6198 RepID=A0A074ZN36_OPIVI|nr:hypothetical protein T265_07635 [Opisthorchis viverrini]KER24745.1 hypothetical protein T265_07635 [Opisthorchis viverrini]
MDMHGAEVRRCGIRRDPPALVVVYHLGLKTRKRTIKLADVRDKSVVDLFNELMRDPSTKNLLQNVPKAQLMRLLTILRDLIHNVPLHESIKRCDEEDVISSGEDLNTVHPDLLERFRLRTSGDAGASAVGMLGSESVKDRFYDALGALLKQAKSSDIVVIAGEMDAQVDRLSAAEARLGGRPGLDTGRTDNGGRLLQIKKAIMDELFEQNRIDPTHPEFEYDKEVDFPQDKVETCLWDSDECEL